MVEATENFSLLDRLRIRYRNMRKNMVQRAMQLKSAGKKQDHILPDYEKEENERYIRALYEARLADRERTKKSRARWRRVKYMVSGNRKLLEDEDDRVRDVDDLILAARAGNYTEVIDILLHPTHPVSPNQVNQDGITPTYAAMQMILKSEVLDSDADLAMLQSSRWEKLYKTLFKGSGLKPQLDIVLRAMMYMGGDIDFDRIEPGVDGYAMMHSAAEIGAVDMMDWLLKNGTPLNIRTTLQQKTPLMMALQYNQLEAVNLLLRRGVLLHLELKDVNGWTALHYAASYARVELSIVRCVDLGFVFVVVLCYSHLFFSLCMCTCVFYKILLTCGAKSNARNAIGRLPSEEARSRGRTEVASAILTFKSSVDTVRDRLDSLMNTTDDHYRKHRLHKQVHSTIAGRATTAAAASTLQGPSAHAALARRREEEQLAAAAAAAASGEYDSREGEEGKEQEVMEDEELLLQNGAFSGHGTGGGESGTVAGAGAEVTALSSEQAQQALAQMQRIQEDKMVRRLSIAVASADPWSLGGSTRPKSAVAPSTALGASKISFYAPRSSVERTETGGGGGGTGGGGESNNFASSKSIIGFSARNTSSSR
jgi:ankyrin repeat protein